MYFRKSNIRSHHLDVQETNFIISQFYRISEINSLDAGLCMDGLPALDYWDVVIEVLRSSKSTESPAHGAAGNCSRNHKQIQTQSKREIEMLINCHMWTTSPQTQIFLKASLGCTSLKTMK